MRIYGGGMIKVKPDAEIPQEIHEKGVDAFGIYYEPSFDGGLSVYTDGGFADDLENYLNAILPYAESGRVDIEDADGDRCRYAIRNGKIYIEQAKIVYLNSETGEWEE